MNNTQTTIKNIAFEGVQKQLVCGRLEGTKLSSKVYTNIKHRIVMNNIQTIIKNIDFEGVQNQLVCGRLEGTKLDKSIETDQKNH